MPCPSAQLGGASGHLEFRSVRRHFGSADIGSHKRGLRPDADLAVGGELLCAAFRHRFDTTYFMEAGHHRCCPFHQRVDGKICDGIEREPVLSSVSGMTRGSDAENALPGMGSWELVVHAPGVEPGTF